MTSIDLGTLQDERARCYTAIDDILNTAASEARGLTPEEEASHQQLVARAESYDELIARAEGTGGAARRSTSTPNRVSNPPPAAERSLDELFYCSPEEVPAIRFARSGMLIPDPTGATAPVERVAVRSIDGMPIYSPRLDEIAHDHRGAVRRFQAIVPRMVLWGFLVDRSTHTSGEAFEAARAHPYWREQWDHAMRALDVDTAAEGANWVPTGIGASWHEKIRAAGKIAPLFARIDLPTNPWKWPIEGADATAYRVAEPTADNETKMTASTPGTLAATFDAEIFGARTLFSRSVEADSAAAMLPFVEAKLVRAFVDGEEKAILDGDTDGTHQDSDVGASTTDTRTAWDGLRKKALAQTATDGGAAELSASLLATVRATMGKWGINPADLAIIVGIRNFYQLLEDTALLTLEKLGPQATILTGQLASLYGAPVIVSEHVREDLNAAGVYDGITTSRSYALIVNRAEWAIGQRMALDVQVDDSIYRETFQRVAVAFQREDMQHIGDAATNDDTAIVYELA